MLFSLSAFLSTNSLFVYIAVLLLLLSIQQPTQQSCSLQNAENICGESRSIPTVAFGRPVEGILGIAKAGKTRG
jgi:hypothetical protein